MGVLVMAQGRFGRQLSKMKGWHGLGEGTRGQEGPYKWGSWGSITAQLRGTDVLLLLKDAF